MDGLTISATVLGILVSGLSLMTGTIGAIAWMQSRTRKQYAAERDFAHLKRHYEGLTHNVEGLWRQTEEWHNNVSRQLDRIEAKVSQE